MTLFLLQILRRVSGAAEKTLSEIAAFLKAMLESLGFPPNLWQEPPSFLFDPVPKEIAGLRGQSGQAAGGVLR